MTAATSWNNRAYSGRNEINVTVTGSFSERRHDRERPGQRDQRVHQRIAERVQRECTPAGRRQGAPDALAKYLNKALVAARSPPDERTSGRFLARHVARIVDHADALAERAELNADVGVLHQTLFVPAADTLDQRPLHEDGVTAERNHPDARVKVEPGLNQKKYSRTLWIENQWSVKFMS